MAEKYIVDLKERLGIKDEGYKTNKTNKTNKTQRKENTSPEVNEALGSISRKSKLLNDGLRVQLKAVLDKLEREVTLVSIVDETNPKSIELRDFILDICDLGEKVKCCLLYTSDAADDRPQV